MPLSSEQARKNALIGGGRPAGSLSAQGKLKLKMNKVFNTRVYKITSKLFEAQAVVAFGTYKMIRMYKDEAGMPHVETIRDEKRMQNLLDTGQYGTDYIVVAGEQPDWKAADALLNRAYGKPKESLELSGEVSFSLRALAERRLAESKEEETLIDTETVPE